MNYLLLVLILTNSGILLSCSSRPTPKAPDKAAKAVMAEPVWFNSPARFRLNTEMGSIPTHPFFDLTSFRTKKGTGLSYFMVTPKNSDHLYELDMVSGRRYRKMSYCKQRDIWESYTSEIHKPNFAQGIVGRLLDNTSRPQRIWVFGDESRFFSSSLRERDQSQRARVVGGVILQYCQKYPCKTGKGWTSQLILIAVNAFDPDFKDVENMQQLKKKIDWKYTVAFAQNGFGHSVNGPHSQPAYRLVSEVPAEKALNFAYKSGHEFSFEEMISLRKNCYFLYDYIWRGQAKVRTNMSKERVADDKAAIILQNRAAKIIEIKNAKLQTIFNDDIESQLKEDEKRAAKSNQLLRLGEFYHFILTKYGSKLRTCMKFVRPASIQSSRERTWFFAFVNNWLNLEGLDRYYSCGAKTWFPNPRLGNGKRRFDASKRSICSSQAIDLGFDKSINTMASLAGNNSPHYRFVEYDNGIGGSHQHLFSWVPDDGKKLGCNARKLEEKSVLFPNDVSWRDYDIYSKKNSLKVVR